MGLTKRVSLSFLCIAFAWAADGATSNNGDKSGGKKPADQSAATSAQVDLVATPLAKPHVDYARVPLSFEPNLGQAHSSARFLTRSRGYSLGLDATGAIFQFNGQVDRNVKAPVDSLRMDLENGNRQATLTGESPLPGKADYFPTGDPKSWITNVPTYSRVRYKSVYPGVDVTFYGTANRLEFDFSIQAGFDPNLLRMKISGSDQLTVNGSGDLVLAMGNRELHFLKPFAYQVASDGKTRNRVEAAYQIAKNAAGEPVVTFALGKYDHTRTLIVDPVVDALSYSEYINQFYVGAVTVDSSGNSYVAGRGTPNNAAFYVNKYGPTGTQLYSAFFGTGNNGFPYSIAVDSSGNAYVTGQIYADSTVPATSNAYQTAPGPAFQQVFLAEVSSNFSSLTYCTYFNGGDTNESNGIAVALDSSNNIYVGGNTESASWPTTSGAYQTTNSSGFEIGWVAKFNPSNSGTASLIYSTLMGSPTNSGSEVNKIAVDYAGNAYLAIQSPQGFPVTSGAVNYTGLYSGNGGAYVTKLNPTGTALVYNAYLGYGGASGIAIDTVTSGTPSAYVSGWISPGGQDFPTTAAAYQTSYASGFAVKLNGTGTAETYSTFLSGPSGYTTNSVDEYPTIAVPFGCTGSCNAYIAGRTNSSDFPTIDPIQSSPAATPYSAFIVELNSTGSSALFSSYLSGYTTQVDRTQDDNSFGITPAIAVDSSGNMYVVGNTTDYAYQSDFPTTIPYTNQYSRAFLAKISASATAGLTLTQPSSVNFGNQTVNIQSGIATIRLSNYSGAAVTGLSIQATPSVFAESDNCSGGIPAGGNCTLDVTFTPTAPSTRNGTLTITSSASNSPITVTLSGTGYDSQYAQPSVSSLTFPSQTVGTTSAAQTFTITNQGDETTSLNITTNAGQFATLNNCPPQLAPGASCTVSVTFSPTQPGLYNSTLTIATSNGPYFYVSLSGTGSVSGASAVLTPTTSSFQFDPQVVGTTSDAATFYLTNTGTEPVTVYSYAASGNFNITYSGCGAAPYEINPQQSCQYNVTFSPTTTGALTGAVTFADNATGSPQSVSLTGTGVASTETVEFNPSTSISFPDTPQGTASGNQTIYLENTGSAPMTIDRTTISGPFTMTYSSCEGMVINGTSPDGLGNAGDCQVNVQFTPAPTATGSQTGTLTFVDSASNSPQVVNLQGNVIAATGTIGVAPSTITFGPQPQGVTSGVQDLYVKNPGNTPVTVTAVTFTGPDPSDYSVTSSNCGTFPFVLAPGQVSCYVPVYFTPGGTGSRTATLTVASSAGNSTATLDGTGETATQAIGLTPTSFNFGSIVEGQSGNYEGIYLRNTGTETVTFTANATITGTNAGDFTLSNGCANNGNTLAPTTATCGIGVQFHPTTVGSESATLTFTDTAGTQTLALSGTGVSTTPTYTTEYHAFNFPTQIENTTSPTQYYTYFYNNGNTSVTLGNVAVTGSFMIPSGDNTCSGQTIGAGSNCYVYVNFAPTTTGYLTGTLTFNNSTGSALTGAPVLPLAGFSVAPTYSAYVNPTTNRFVEFQVVGTTSGADATYLYNTGNTAFTVGTVSGTNLGVAPSAEFSIASANGGYDGCSNQTVQPGSYCQVNITFTPSAAGTRTGTINFPVTYANSSTATITGNLTGTGVAEKNSAVLTPPNGAFIDQVVGTTTTYNVTAYLNNNGNQPFTVGTLTNTNSTEFSTASSVGGYDSCSGVTVQVGGSCQINVRFTPSATGTRTGSIGFPVTFADHTTATPTLALTGTGVSSAKTIAINPSSLNFTTEIQSVTSVSEGLTVTNTGNQTVTIGTDSISTNSAEFSLVQDYCTGSLTPTQTCMIYISFTPGSSATGAQSGVLTIADNATGGPHTVALAGIAITAAQQVAVSQSTVAFGNQPAGSTSSVQTIYFTDQGDSAVSISAIALGGTNAANFQITYNGCVGGISAHSTCYVNVVFAPPTGSSGAMTATLMETDSSATHNVTLTGTAVTPGPAAALSPSSMTFPKQNVGSTSAPQNFSVTNTGSANLAITAVADTNTAEFPVYTDTCSGTTLTPHQQCTIGVQFSPSLGGTRTGTIKVTDNATGSPQSLPVSGLGYGIPEANLNPSTLTYATTNQGTTTAAQSTTLSNTGTDTLNISSITLTGPNAGDFTISSKTCGATLAPTVSCTISVKFDPTAPGSRTASITVTDNANNLPGSTQGVTLNGTGLGVPTASVSSPLTFSSTSVGGSGTPQAATLSNTGGGTLTIAGIGFTGAGPGDFAQTNNCGASLAAGSSCTISVTFKPTATGTRTANLTFTDNSGDVGNSKQNIALTGSAVAPVAPTAVSVSPNSGTGAGPQSFTFTYSDSNPGGYQDLQLLVFVFYNGSTYANSCYGQYNVAANRVVLYNNAGTGSAGYITPGGTGTVSNSQCSISAAGTSVVPSGNNMTLTLPITFSTTFPGTMTIHGVAYDNESQDSGANLGTWNTGVEQPPTIVSLSPNSGSGLGPQVFAFTYSDPNGTADLDTLYFNFSPGSESSSNACYVYYATSTNTLHLYNNAGSGLVPGSTIVGSGGTLSNSQCSISGVGSSVSTSGNNLTLSVSITFQSTFTAPTNVYMNAFDNEGEKTGFVNEGTYTP